MCGAAANTCSHALAQFCSSLSAAHVPQLSPRLAVAHEPQRAASNAGEELARGHVLHGQGHTWREG